MIYIYRRRNSTGARDLAEAITMTGTIARRTKGAALRNLAGDVVVCWGDHFAAAPNTRTLNNVAPLSKFEEARTLAEKGVATVQVSRTRPVEAQGRPAVPAVRPSFTIPAALNRAEISELQAQTLLREIAAYLQRPLPPGQPAIPAETWLPRINNHVGGNDLLNAVQQEPDFYSKKEEIVEEYRLHIFNGKSIRAGKKIARPTRPNGLPTHPWIRSFDAGWIIQYDGFSSTKDMRTLAAKAVKALGLDFAAVDLGKKADGSLIVLEVNRAPGVEGGTLSAYARHITNWVNGRGQGEER